jgi:hypothetical protein
VIGAHGDAVVLRDDVRVHRKRALFRVKPGDLGPML